MGWNRTLNGIQIIPPYLFMKLTCDYRCSGNRNSDRDKDRHIACAASWIIHVLEVGVARLVVCLTGYACVCVCVPTRTIKVFQQRNRFVNLFTQVSVCVWANNSKVSVKSFSTLSTIPHSQPLGSVVKIRLHNLTHKFDTKKKMNFPQMHKTFVLTINADRRLSNMENAEDLL